MLHYLFLKMMWFGLCFFFMCEINHKTCGNADPAMLQFFKMIVQSQTSRPTLSFLVILLKPDKIGFRGKLEILLQLLLQISITWHIEIVILKYGALYDLFKRVDAKNETSIWRVFRVESCFTRPQFVSWFVVIECQSYEIKYFCLVLKVMPLHWKSTVYEIEHYCRMKAILGIFPLKINVLVCCLELWYCVYFWR